MENTKMTLALVALAGLTTAGAGPGPATAQELPTDVRFADVTLPPLVVTVPAAGPVAPADTSTGTIVDVAASAGQFETLLAAAREAGLAETLSGEGPFTVFAPTDAAFAALPEGTVESLLGATEKLRAVLTYHVVAGRVTSEQVVKLDRAGTVNGAEVRIEVRDGQVWVNDARVVRPDVEASNGVIHVIDSVLLPPEK